MGRPILGGPIGIKAPPQTEAWNAIFRSYLEVRILRISSRLFPNAPLELDPGTIADVILLDFFDQLL